MKKTTKVATKQILTTMIRRISWPFSMMPARLPIASPTLMLVEGDFGYTADYTVLLTLGEDSPAASYRITQGANSTWTQNTDQTLTVRANGELSKFTGVKVDGELIDEEHYTAVSGSTVITLQTDYLETLSVGTHKLTVVYTDGECSTNFEVKKAEGDKTDPAKPASDKDTTSPQTGDNSNMFLWGALLFVSGGVLTVFSVASKKKRVGINK